MSIAYDEGSSEALLTRAGLAAGGSVTRRKSRHDARDASVCKSQRRRPHEPSLVGLLRRKPLPIAVASRATGRSANLVGHVGTVGVQPIPPGHECFEPLASQYGRTARKRQWFLLPSQETHLNSITL